VVGQPELQKKPDKQATTTTSAAKKSGAKPKSEPVSIQKTFSDAGSQTDDLCDLVQVQDNLLQESLLKCVKALLLPVSQDVHAMKKELDDLKLAVTQLASSVSAIIQSGSIKSSNSNDVSPESLAQQANDHHDGQRGSTEVHRIGDATEAATDRGHHSQGRDLSQSQQQSHVQSQSSGSGRVNRGTRRRDTDEFDTRRLKQDVMASMYIDMDQKQRRANNIVVTGIPYGDDFTTVTNLLAEEFDLQYIPTVSCRRIGRPVDNRVQPLLITLESRQDADYFIANARYLRESYDPAVRECVYISADLTPAESKAAYELRCRRRRNRDQNFQQQNVDQSTFALRGRH